MENRYKEKLYRENSNMQEKDSRKAVFVSRFLGLLKDNSLTQSELSKIVKISQATISAYSLGKTTPKSEELCRIASYFGVSMDYLWGVSDIPIQATDTANIQESEWQQRAQTAEQKLKHLKSLLADVGSDIESLGGTVGKLLKFISE